MDNIKTNHQILLTTEGLEELKKEYDELVKTKRPEAVARVAAAREAGDLSENSEYAAARDDLSFIEGRIAEIEEILNAAHTISKKRVNKGIVDVGCKVALEINKKKDVFTIVGEWEADPTAKKISHASPLGKALLGKKKGDTVEVDAPVGKVKYTILKID